MKIYVLVIAVLSVVSTIEALAQEKGDKAVISFSKIEQLVGSDINLIQKGKVKSGIVVRDTVFQSDEGESWPGLVYYSHGRKVFFAETSWQNKNVIKKIVITDNSLKSPSGVRVGDNFVQVKNKVSSIVRSYPDGYFALQDKRNKKLSYFFDVDTHFNEGIGNISFDSISSDLTIMYMVIEE